MQYLYAVCIAYMRYHKALRPQDSLPTMIFFVCVCGLSFVHLSAFTKLESSDC